jgi:tetratricopeptide (TPR) repeat protein
MSNKHDEDGYSVPMIQELLEDGKAIEAIEILHTMIATNPNQAELYYHLGEAFYQEGQWDRACQAYYKAVNLQPSMAQASIGFGDASVELKAYAEADKAYRYALQQDPSVVKQLALCYKTMGDALAADLQGELSYKSYYNAFGLDDSLVSELQAAFADLSDMLRQAGQLEYAQQAQIQAERFAQELEALRLLEAGNANEALPLLQAIVAENPKRATLHYQLGEAYYQLQEWKAACEAYLQALNLKADMVEASLKFAAASIELGSYTEAEKALAYALEKNPKIVDSQVAQLYKRIGDGFTTESIVEQAHEAYQKALALDATLSTDILTSLFEVLENGNSFGAGSAASSEENELLLLQLHQVQEELEQYFFKNQSLESKLQDTESKLQDSKSKLQDTESKLQDSKSKLQDTESKLQDSKSKLQDTESKLQDERKSNEKLQKLEQENTELAQRQQLFDEELIKAEAQIELIKDVLIREKAF